MSITTTRLSPDHQEIGSPVYSPPRNYNRGEDSPIKMYMKQNNNFYLQLQEEAKNKQLSNTLTLSQLKNLKQFQRQLEQQPSPKTKRVPINETYLNNSQRVIRTETKTQQPVESYIEEGNLIYQHRAKQTRINGQKVIDKIKSFILDERPLKSPRSPKKKPKPGPYDHVNSTIDKLYKQRIKQDMQRRQIHIRKFEVEEAKQNKDFKVQNPKSMFLIEKKNNQQGGHRPLYERALEIARQKSQAQLELQLARQQQLLLQEQQELEKYEEIKRQRHAEHRSKEKQEKFYQQIQLKEKLRNFAKQQQKMLHMQHVAKLKPNINKMSKQIFNKKVQRDQLSKNFVKRTQQYGFQREKQKMKVTQKYDAQYCPFTPQISQASRQMAQNYHQRKRACQQNKKKQAAEQILSKRKLIEMRKNAEKSKSPAAQKSKSPKRSNSSHLLQNKQKLNKTGTNLKVKPVQHDQIPIYNRYFPEKMRTLSCVNVGCRKL